MKNITNKIIYILIWILFIALLLFSNSIIASLRKDNFTRIKENIEFYKKDIVYLGLDDIHIQEDMYDSFNFDGWVFCETEKENNSKNVFLVLLNDTKTYIKKVELINRSDVFNTFKDSLNIKGNYHGISDTVSTINIKKGIYKILIYCKENDYNYGLADTGILLKKDDKGISRYAWESSQKNITINESIRTVKDAVEYPSIVDNKFLQIKGWAFAAGLNSANQSVYIRLLYGNGDKVTYDTQSISRPDVGSSYNDHRYNNSGFRALIPIEKIPKGELNFEIIIEKSGILYSSPTFYTFVQNDKDEGNFTRNTRDYEQLEIKFYIDVDYSVRYKIESYLINESLAVKGWAFISDKTAFDSPIYIGITSADGTTGIYRTNKVSKPDVAKVFENELYTESGFEVEIPLDAIKIGENTITVIVDNGQMLKASEPFVFNYISEDKK